MPVYNGSKYLKESIESILKQTFKDFELVCVDDSSTDNSYDILKQFASKDSRIKLFQKPNGGYVPKSWNFVMPYLLGDNILYMSQDDLMSEDNLEKLYLRQQETGADAVLPDMELYYQNEQENERKVGFNGNRDIILTNKEAVIASLKNEIPGFALWKSKLFNDEQFPEDSFNSDEFMTRKLYFKSNKVAFCNGVFFYRQDNKLAITKTFDLKNYYGILTNLRDCTLLDENNFNPFDIASQFYITYLAYIRLYVFSSYRKAINSDIEFQRVELMLNGIYSRLNKNKPFELSKHLKGFKQVQFYMIGIIFYNLQIFKISMFLLEIFYRIYVSIKIYMNRFF